MTALDKYVRLESDGLWRADAEAQRRDVVVSFGDATLVIADGAGRPIAHWSLPAIARQNPGERPAIYTPDPDGSEIIEIADATMIDAIDQVQAALAKARPHPGKLRHWITAGVVAVTLALAVFWLPGALRRQTLAVVPLPKRVEIGATILGHMQTQTGAACREANATQAAGRLAKRLFGAETKTQVVVVPELAQGALSIPGGLILVDYGLVQAAPDPAAMAGYILASRAAVIHMDPLGVLLEREGLSTTFRLLTTGEIPNDVLRDYANDMLADPAPQPDIDALHALFVSAQVPQAPYLALVDRRSGTMPDLAAMPADGAQTPMILTDGDWVSLQNICNI